MVTWTQMYMPMGGLGLSALVALIPIIFFFVALAVLRLKGHVAGAITLILSILIAIFAFVRTASAATCAKWRFSKPHQPQQDEEYPG